MMVLYTYNWGETIIWVMSTLLVILLLVILYRKLLSKLNRKNFDKKEFCVLYSLEKYVNTGEIEIYFTNERSKNVELSILDNDLNTVTVIVDKEFSPGGNIIRFDTGQLTNGIYFYCLRTDNQKTMKKMTIRHQ